MFEILFLMNFCGPTGILDLIFGNFNLIDLFATMFIYNKEMTDMLSSMLDNLRLIDIVAVVFAIITAILAIKDFWARRDIGQKKYNIIEEHEKLQFELIEKILKCIRENKVNKKDFSEKKRRERLIHDFTWALKTHEMINKEFDFIFSLPYRNNEIIEKMPVNFRVAIILSKMLNLIEMSGQGASEGEIEDLYDRFLTNYKILETTCNEYYNIMKNRSDQ